MEKEVVKTANENESACSKCCYSLSEEDNTCHRPNGCDAEWNQYYEIKN